MNLARLPSLPRGKYAWALGLALVSAFIASFCCFTGFYGGDDIYYFSAARELAGDGSAATSLRDLNPLAYVRLGLHIPNALLYHLTDGDVKLIAWFQIGYHLGLVLVAYALARVLDDELSGVITAGLVATFPIYYLYSGAVLPDVPMAFWLGCVLLLLEVARRRTQRKRSSFRSQALLHVAAGVGLGLAYTVKETALVMTIPAAIHVMTSSGRFRDLTWLRNGLFMLGGLLVVLGLEAIALRISAGEWLFRPGLSSEVQAGFEMRVKQQGSGILERFQYAASKRLLGVIPVSLWLMVLSSLAYPLLRKRSWGLLAFFWWPALYLTVGSTSLTHYLPPSIQTRYYSIIVLPALVMCVLVSRFLAERFRAWKARPTRLPTWSAAAILSMLGAWTVQHEFRNSLIQPGAFVQASYARAFSQAYDMSRREYPAYPIILSGYYQRVMSPLLFPRAPSGVLAHPSVSSQEKPRPPFLFLGRASSLPDEGRAAAVVAKLGYANVCTKTVATIAPPKGRDEAIEAAFGSLLERSTVGDIQQLGRAAATIVLVSPAAASGCQMPLPRMEVVEKNARMAALDSGYVASWSAKDPFYLRLFDDRAYRRAPEDPRSLLNPPSTRFRVDVKLQSLITRATNVLVHVYGYDSEGNLVAKAYEKTLLAADGTAATLSVEVLAESPMVRYRTWIKVAPRAKSGRLFIHPPTAHSSVAPEATDAFEAGADEANTAPR